MTRRQWRPRAVFDCNIFVQALAYDDGPSAECVRSVESGYVELFVSGKTLAELRNVLSYPEVLAISPGMTAVRIAALQNRLAFRGTLVRRVKHFIDYPRDRNDEPYLDLVTMVKADYLVTQDNDLLSLMTGYSAICKQFHQKTHPLRVVKPVDFLNAIGKPWHRQ
jgi:putative PIN family toxin of toxin-antitoxin system